MVRQLNHLLCGTNASSTSGCKDNSPVNTELLCMLEMRLYQLKPDKVHT